MSAALGQPRNPINPRSVALGLAGVILICGLTPYNDYALNNTFLIGNNFPLGVVMLLFGFAVFVNGPLSRWFPKLKFSAGEITVAFSMTLVSCALPSSGLMRYFPASLVAPWHIGQSDREFIDLMESLHVPRWIYPSFAGAGPRQWMNDPIVEGYWGRWTEAGPPPYLAWLKPALTWGIFLGALYGALLCMVAIVRRQWVENERLAFPLAQIYLALLDEPPQGKFLNRIMAARTFWIAFGCIFALHLWNGLARYQPKHFPEIWVYYSLPNLFTEQPWSFVEDRIKDSAVFFTVVGVTYFIPTSIAFSLWFFFILQQIQRMWLGTYIGDPLPRGRHDEHFGGLIAYLIAIAWIGRAHWRMVIAQALRGPRGDEPRGKYLSYPAAFWGFVACAVIMTAWLMAAGANFFAASVSVALLLMLFLIITRFIAEAGLVHGQLQVPMYKPWQLLVRAGIHRPVPLESYYMSALLQTVHYDFREVVPVYASHAIKVADETLFNQSQITNLKLQSSTGRRFIALLALALFIGYFVSFASTLWTEYRYAYTKDVQQKQLNDWGVKLNPDYSIVGAMTQYQKENFSQAHSSAAHITFGFGFTALLSFLRLRYTWWPLHPIGYLMLETFPSQHLWLSFFVGWVAKVFVLRFGGPRGYLNARPFFLGLIVGESAAAGFWLIMGIVLSSLGMNYRPVNIMPG